MLSGGNGIFKIFYLIDTRKAAFFWRYLCPFLEVRSGFESSRIKDEPRQEYFW
jgi:hypothetical protein